MLVGTQWGGSVEPPTNPNFLPDDAVPAMLSNMTLETYIQNYTKSTPNGGPGSCIGCHRFATLVPSPQPTADFSFLPFLAQPSTARTKITTAKWTRRTANRARPHRTASGERISLAAVAVRYAARHMALLSDSPTVLPVHRRILAFSFIGWIFDFYDLLLLSFVVASTPLIKDLALSQDDVAVLLGTALAFTAVGGLLGGAFADRFGRKPLLLITILIYCESGR